MRAGLPNSQEDTFYELPTQSTIKSLVPWLRPAVENGIAIARCRCGGRLTTSDGWDLSCDR